MSKQETETTAWKLAFAAWWKQVSISSEPIRKPPRLATDAFEAGWGAAMSVIYDIARTRLGGANAERR